VQRAVYAEDIHDWLSNPHRWETRPTLSDELDAAAEKLDALFQAVASEEDKAEWGRLWSAHRELVAISYHPARVCSNSKCARRGTIKSKTGSSGITSWVCQACGVVQSEEVFTSLPDERNFEEKEEKATATAKWHRQKYARTAGYQNTTTLLREHSKAAGLEPDAALRNAAVVICAVLGDRSRKDPLLLSTSLDTHQSLPQLVAGLACADVIKEAITKCLTRDWVQKGKLESLSSRALGIFSRALQLFRAAYKGKRVYRPAFLSAVAAMREFDQHSNGNGAHAFWGSCRLHLLDDFVDDKEYCFEIRKPVTQLRWDEPSGEWKKKAVRKVHTLRVHPYTTLFKEYCAFTKQEEKKVRIQDIGNMVGRILNEFHLVAPWTPIQEISNADDIPCYIYRIRARARVLEYWQQIVALIGASNRNTKEGEKSRAMLKDFDKRENVLVACAVVYSAFRDNSRNAMHHPWPRMVLNKMEALALEEINAAVPNFVAHRRQFYKHCEASGMDQEAATLSRELDAYESYREAKKQLGGHKLTERDAFFPFHLRWFGVLFQVAGRRITECCSKMPKINYSVVQATQKPETILGLAPGYVWRLEQRAKEIKAATAAAASAATPFQSASGVAVVEPIGSRVGSRKRKAVD
jgi:hypothetical protein